ncbi:helix-hairpin-helix domain-containing protein [Polaribacter pectinis]|uniref:Helix-hairpin-helix domain-containing protein n=1 Tax=Polaribacter pectinis TaxID=2738844 RepID=A0A7G9LBE4_9FLAO|nr:helix-hairpin-helix domain-containing protein [Polaribacter pectinis]QNM85943.1 helix-hairpin-helix domain-containing protein [Polaribacter pectinis]
MNIFKSHFWYNKSQRNGIFFLIILIVLFQVAIFFDVFSSNDKIVLENPEILAFQSEIDSLKKVEFENRKPKIYPFNPNYITDYKGGQLGMSLSEIDRLLAFRKTNKFVNSKKEFQQITKVSDSLLNKISPYFKFPDWVVKRNLELERQNSNKHILKNKQSTVEVPINRVSTADINKATIIDLQSIDGVGDRLSERIIKYRTKLHGFSLNSQLYEVWGLDKQIANKILSNFKILEKPIIKKENINTIEFKQLLKNPYINYNLCVKIFNYRDEVAELQDISELKNIEGFPLDKYERIVLYLMAE